MFEGARRAAATEVVDPLSGAPMAWHPSGGEWVVLEPTDLVDDELDAMLRDLAAAGLAQSHDEHEAGRRSAVAEACPTEPRSDVAADLERVPTGPGLAAVLAALDVASADAHDLVECGAAWAKVVSWAVAHEAEVLAKLAARPELRPAETGYRSVNPITNTAFEVAGRCQLTFKQAENAVGHAVQLVEDFPDTWAALEAGLIDMRRVRAITDELGGQDPAVRRRVEAAVLPRAPFLDSVALRKLVKRLLFEAAPVETAERVRVARDGRYVAVTPASDGMAHLEARLPAEDAVALNTALNVAAADAKRADAAAGLPARTRDQRRADALAELGWSALSACAGAATAAEFVDRPRPARENVADAAAAVTPGGRPMPARSNRGGTDHHVPGRGGDPSAPARSSPGRVEQDVGESSADAAAAGGSGSGALPARSSLGRAELDGAGSGADTAAAGAIHDRSRHAAESSADVSRNARVRRRPVAVNVTIPFGALAGLTDEPGELEGHGPIPAHVARELAAAGVWTWLRTDPGSGHLLDLGRTRYRPTKALADFIVARDRTCRAPGCHQPATSCDLDHVIPWERGGTTCAANLQPLCEVHHLLKHHGGWRVEHEPDGTTVWVSPTGHRYRRPRDDQAAAGNGRVRVSSQRSVAVQAPETSR